MRHNPWEMWLPQLQCSQNRLFPSLVAVRALHVIVGCSAQEFGCIPPQVCAEKEGGMTFEPIAK